MTWRNALRASLLAVTAPAAVLVSALEEPERPVVPTAVLLPRGGSGTVTPDNVYGFVAALERLAEDTVAGRWTEEELADLAAGVAAVRSAVAVARADRVVCGWCGGGFRAERSSARWCSARCRQAAWRDRQRDP